MGDGCCHCAKSLIQPKFTIQDFPWKLKALNIPQNSKTATRQILPVHLLSRWGERFLVLLSLPSSCDSLIIVSQNIFSCPHPSPISSSSATSVMGMLGHLMLFHRLLIFYSFFHSSGFFLSDSFWIISFVMSSVLLIFSVSGSNMLFIPSLVKTFFFISEIIGFQL